MDDLVKQLRDVAEATGPNDARQIAIEAAARIEALEARIAKADALAKVLEEPHSANIKRIAYETSRVRNALAAYRADQ